MAKTAARRYERPLARQEVRRQRPGIGKESGWRRENDPVRLARDDVPERIWRQELFRTMLLPPDPLRSAEWIDLRAA